MVTYHIHVVLAYIHTNNSLLSTVYKMLLVFNFNNFKYNKC